MKLKLKLGFRIASRELLMPGDERVVWREVVRCGGWKDKLIFFYKIKSGTESGTMSCQDVA